MNDKIISQLQSSIRLHIPYADSWLLALQLIAWAKLSFKQEIDTDIRIQSLDRTNAEQIRIVLDKLALLPGLVGQSFAGIKIPTKIDSPGFSITLMLCTKYAEAGMLDEFDPTYAIAQNPSRMVGDLALPSEVADLMIGLVAAVPRQSIYIPWDIDAQFAARAIKIGADVYLETPNHSALPALVGVLLGGNLSLRFTDPVSEPLAIENGKLRKFDAALAFPPFGLRYDVDVIDHDWFNRFPERTQSGTVLAIRHLLAQTHRRIVIAVPNNLMFSIGAERALREDLVNRGIVETVISIPSGLFAISNVAFSILVLDPRGGHNQIRFVNGDSEYFRDPISKARARLKNIDHLLDMAAGRITNNDVVIVPIQAVLENDAQLQVSRYVLADSTKKIQTLIELETTVPLGDLVSTVRPMPTKQDSEDSIEAWEVGAADLPTYGYIRTTGRSVKIDSQTAEKNKHQFLRPLDIVLVVKGSVGKVGVIPLNIPDPGEGGWVAGQSAIVLRVSDAQKIDARTLGIFLRSPLGQELIKGIVSGATIPLIQLRELARLPIIVLSAEKASAVANALNEEARLQDEIDRLIVKQAQVAPIYWNLELDRPQADKDMINTQAKVKLN